MRSEEELGAKARYATRTHTYVGVIEVDERFYWPNQYIVGSNREMLVHAVRTVAAERRFRGGRFSVEEGTDTDYGPCIVVRVNTGRRSGPIGKIVLQEAPRGLIVKTLPDMSDYDSDGALFRRFRLELAREFGRRGIKPQD